MKKRFRKILVLLAALTMLVSSALPISAAGLRDFFDAELYAESYPDLKEAFGNDEEALYQHYLTYGIKEGRCASLVFDVAAYREMYGDLDAAFGDDWDAYAKHYFEYGIKERRDGGGDFDPVAYAEAYGDIREAFGDDYKAIIQHYVTHGIKENRTAGSTVKVPEAAVPVITPTEPPKEDVPIFVPTVNVDYYAGEEPFGDYPFDGGGNTNYGVTVEVGELTKEELIAYMPTKLMAVDYENNKYPVTVSWNCDNYDSNTVGAHVLYGTVTAADDTKFTKLPGIIGVAFVEAADNGCAFGGYYRLTFGDVTIYYEKLTEKNSTFKYPAGTPFVDVLKDISDMIVEYGGNGSFYTQVLKDWNITGLDTNTPGEYQITAKISGVQFAFDRPDITVTVVIE